MANRKTVYEWDIETFTQDEFEDIEDHNFSDECPGIPDEPNLRLVLVQDIFEWPSNDPNRKCDPDLVSRLWAYVENGKLPEFFEDCGRNTSVRVPKKFHDELTRAIINDTKAVA